jgi:folate-binding protein YgfZ
MQIDPVSYERVAHHVGLFDASTAFGRVVARGKDAIDLLHRMSTNDLKPLESTTGRAALTVLTNEKARFIDAIKVVRDTGGDTLLLTSGGKEQEVIQWLDRYVIMEDAKFIPATELIAQLLLCGPLATTVLHHFSTTTIAEDRGSVSDISIAGMPATILRAPSLAGSGWFVLMGAQFKEAIWDRLSADVLEMNGSLIDLALFDLLRIENATPIAPNEINDKHNPLETGFATEAVSFTKGCYIGQEVIARLDAQQKVQRHLMRLEIAMPWADAQSELMNRALPLKLIAPEHVECGELTSYAASPAHQKVIGLGYVRSAFAKDGAAIGVAVNEAVVLPAVLHSI